MKQKNNFSVMFWNVENFGRNLEGDEPESQAFVKRVNRISNHIKRLNPDVFGLAEIMDKVSMRTLLMDKLSEYDFAITDGAQSIELLAGWKRNTFEQVIFTQRREFKAGDAMLRPGSLTSVKFNGEFYNILFLHTDSGKKIQDYNNCQEMFRKIWRLKKVLDKVREGKTKLIAMGDLNTMGRKKSGSSPAISPEKEIEHLAKDAKRNGMRLLMKTHDSTWRKGPKKPRFESNLDHALATENIAFKTIQDSAYSQPAQVSVDGWNRLHGKEKDDFTMKVSDHCSIFCTIKCT